MSMSYDEHILNDKYWDFIPLFIRKDIKIESLDVEILGYFPYHIARIRPSGLSQTYLPRQLFEALELELIKNHINDNKAVYICKTIKNHTGARPFAIMFKDDYVIINTWENVVNYDNSRFKIKSNK